jgi:hypothetical protein
MKPRRTQASTMTAGEVAKLTAWSRRELAALGLTPLAVFRARLWLRLGGRTDTRHYDPGAR